jgi:plastocyanin
MLETTMRSRIAGGVVAAFGLALMLAACGGSSSNSSNPAGPSPTTPTTTPAGAVNTTTITIQNNVATPKDIIVPLGSQVTFINNDNRQHDMESNPHPEHTECPALAQAGFLNPGQSRQTGNLTTARICGYHDHILADVAGLQGSITVR